MASHPLRPLRPCLQPGCPNLVATGRCPDHQRVRERQRGSAASRGYDRLHQRRRAVVLARDPLCVACLAAGRVVPTTVDDHIVPIEHGGSVDELSNHQGLCASCHGLKRAAESRGQRMVVVQGKGLMIA